MKKFIENLISRLEENIFVAELHGFGWDGQRVSNLLCLEDVKNISKQLAEEYKDKEVLDMVQTSVDYAKARLEELKRISNNGWIPCIERLPEDCTIYEVTAQFENEMCYTEFAYYDESKGEWWKHDDDGLVNVLAWREHSEPYQPKGENELYRAKSVDGEYQEYKGDWK